LAGILESVRFDWSDVARFSSNMRSTLAAMIRGHFPVHILAIG